jgi:hypothetical protein
MKKALFSGLTVLFYFGILLGTLHAVELTPSQIRDEIKRVGAKRVVDTMFSIEPDSQWTRMLDRISTGSNEWLDVAKQLKAESDAGASLDLNLAVAAALPKAPSAVLSVLDGSVEDNSDVIGAFSVSGVCRVPYLVEEYEQLVEARELLRKAEFALLNLDDPDHNQNLTILKKRCLDRLRAAQENLK